MPVKRLRLIIYTHDTQATLEKQRMQDTKSHIWGPNNQSQIESIELDPCRITLLELLRLFKRESRKKGKEDGPSPSL
jgi:hypothetical protein